MHPYRKSSGFCYKFEPIINLLPPQGSRSKYGRVHSVALVAALSVTDAVSVVGRVDEVGVSSYTRPHWSGVDLAYSEEGARIQPPPPARLLIHSRKEFKIAHFIG